MDTDQINSELSLFSKNRNLALHCYQLSKVKLFLFTMHALIRLVPFTTRNCSTPIINYIKYLFNNN